MNIRYESTPAFRTVSPTVDAETIVHDMFMHMNSFKMNTKAAVTAFTAAHAPIHSRRHVRHVRLLKRGLSEADQALPELQREKEACMVSLTRAQLLVGLADCNVLPEVGDSSPMEQSSESAGGGGGSAVLRRVRDAADCMLGEILQARSFKSLQSASSCSSGCDLSRNL